MDQAKAALGDMGGPAGEKGLGDAKAMIQEAISKKGGAEGGQGGNLLAGVDAEKAKALIDGLGEKGGIDTKAAGEEIKGAVENAIGGLGKK